MRNLADNACKHHDRPDGLVTVQAHRANGGLVIDVTDDGPGVPEELRDRIFEPFVTSDTTRGSGFGLAAVADIARTHDADISLTVGTDRGSTFRLRWPLTS